MKVLIVEDQKDLSDEIKSYLKSLGYRCEQAFHYFEAEEKLAVFSYDAVVLDVGLPNGNGLNILKRKWPSAKPGILILSAKNSLDDKLQGLELGADDYLTKPFHLAELNARLKSLVRRANNNHNKELHFRNFRLNPEQKLVMLEGETIPFTSKEYALFEYLVLNKGRVLSKQNLAERLWGDDYDMVDNFDFLYVQIKNLRKKINECGGVDFIKTIHGIGYKVESE